MKILCFSLFYFCVFINLLTVINGQDPSCTARDQCSCVTKDGKVIDISSIGNKDGTPKFKDLQAPDGFMYSYNPCYPFNELDCEQQSVCQILTDYSTSYPSGDANSAVFTYDGLNNIITYTSTDKMGTKRKSQITLICDLNAEDAIVTPLGEQGASIFYMTLTTKCACPNGCVDNSKWTTLTPLCTLRNGCVESHRTGGPKQHEQPTSGISTLDMALIICVSILAVSVMFLVGGIVFWIRRRQADGTTTIPYNTLDGESKRY